MEIEIVLPWDLGDAVEDPADFEYQLQDIVTRFLVSLGIYDVDVSTEWDDE